MLQQWSSLYYSVRYKEHEDGFLRLQLIRYESVELTEQLMRERQNRQGEEDEDSGQTEEQELEEVSPGAAPSELPVELRGLLLEEQRTEKPTVSAEEGSQEEGMMYILTGGLSQGGQDSVMMQLQDAAQQQGMQVVWLPQQSYVHVSHIKVHCVISCCVSQICGKCMKNHVAFLTL